PTTAPRPNTHTQTNLWGMESSAFPSFFCMETNMSKKSEAATLKELALELNFDADLPDYKREKQERAITEKAEREERKRLEKMQAGDLWAMESLERDLKGMPNDGFTLGGPEDA